MNDAKLKQFMDDVCVVIYGQQANFYPGCEQHGVIMESMARLSEHGRALVTQQAAKMKLKSLQEAIETHRRICAEDGIVLFEK